MNEVAISVDSLGKKYRLGERRQAYSTFRETISGMFTRATSVTPREEFWALRDVSFDVPHGEVVGIIGRNGAGKSTLLKILSRITSPSEGSIRVRGRVGALLEVGTGFHPELTGRENIYLSGSILGMAKEEVVRKFDAIVDFAGVEKFIDTPVKRYSSGMAVRLGFAVAAHLEPEILVVDEVLAVGDADFQKKCLGRMDEVSKEGRTVLFVSHNMSTISQLCTSGIVMEQGAVAFNGEINSAVEYYLNNGATLSTQNRFPVKSGTPACITSLDILRSKDSTGSVLDWNDDFDIEVGVHANEATSGTVKLIISSMSGERICQAICANHLRRYTEMKQGEDRRYRATFKGGQLNPGIFVVRASFLKDNATQYDARVSSPFAIEATSGEESFFGTRVPDKSLFRMPARWQDSLPGTE